MKNVEGIWMFYCCYERASLYVCTMLCYMAVKGVVSWHEKLLTAPIPPSRILLPWSWSFPVSISQLWFPTCPSPRNINISEISPEKQGQTFFILVWTSPSTVCPTFTLSPYFLRIGFLSWKVLSQWISNYMTWTSDRHMPLENCRW